MKERLRSKVWWPGVDKDVEWKCWECYGCQLVIKETITPPVEITRMPERPWQDLALDLPRPMPTREFLLVLVDYFILVYYFITDGWKLTSLNLPLLR